MQHLYVYGSWLLLIACQALTGLSFLSRPTSRTRQAPLTGSSVSRPATDWALRASTRRVVVIGGGWAGFSVADALSLLVGKSNSSSFQVELLDASPRGQGGLAGGWRTSKLNRPVEAGLHGFWREYKNTLATIDRIEGIDIDDVLTPYTPSILASESGRVAVAPVLANDTASGTVGGTFNVDWSNPQAVVKTIAEMLPPPLDVALLSEFSPDSPLSVLDRVSGLGLLPAWADFEQEDNESWKRYDAISAENLFLSAAGVSPVLYKELVSPLLHVLPMTPGYDCSAAAALSCFHVFALQSRGAFDVRWCRGTISERIFNPWAQQLQSRGNVNIRGSAKVTGLVKVDEQYTVTVNDSEALICDAVVFAVGGTSMRRLLPSCPPLVQYPVTQQFRTLRGVTCVAVRIFLRPDPVVSSDLIGGQYDSTQLPPHVANAMKDSPVVVCGPRVGSIPQLVESGFCIYDLQRLHDEFAVSWQARDHSQEACAALEVDFFRADAVAEIDDDMDVARLALRAVSAALEVDAIDPSLLLDVAVVRARDAVSHFCVGSAAASPDVRLGTGIYMSGDWIDRTGHASWSTEKAVVTGRQAARSLADDFGVPCESIDIIPAAEDTTQLSALRKVARMVRNIIPHFGSGIPISPLVLAKQLNGRQE